MRDSKGKSVLDIRRIFFSFISLIAILAVTPIAMANGWAQDSDTESPFVHHNIHESIISYSIERLWEIEAYQGILNAIVTASIIRSEDAVRLTAELNALMDESDAPDIDEQLLIMSLEAENIADEPENSYAFTTGEISNHAIAVAESQRDAEPALQSSSVPSPPYTQEEVDMLAKTVWGEARGTSADEQKLVIWTVLQRVMSNNNVWPNTIRAVITQENQFHGYSETFPIDPAIRMIVIEVLEDWTNGEEPMLMYPFATETPYYFFHGDGENNWFRRSWRSDAVTNN